MLVVDRGKSNLLPVLAGRKAGAVEVAGFAACAEPISGSVFLTADRPASSISCTNASMEVPVAASAFATDWVEGQRVRPSAAMRFDLLNVVGSSPDFLASPDGESPAMPARRSSAVQICA
jgi:hypothetical protein